VLTAEPRGLQIHLTKPFRHIRRDEMSVEAEGLAGEETLVRRDSLYGDAEKVSVDKHHVSGASWRQTLQLAFQSIGVVYGDVGTSPLYVYSSTFPHGIKHRDDLLGVLFLILYTLVLLAMLKYVFIVLYANDNGDGELPGHRRPPSRPAGLRAVE
jgi:KUP system potassium uptake protein